MERIIKDFRIANNRTGVPWWQFDLLRTGVLSLALLIEIVPRIQTIMPLLCVCTSRSGRPHWYSDLLPIGGHLSRVLAIKIVPRNQI